MELLKTLSARDILSLIGLILVMTAAYLIVRQRRRNKFTYFTATLMLAETDFGGALKFYSRSIPDKVLRICKNTGQWELRGRQRRWTPLSKVQVDQVEEMLSKRRDIELIVD